MPQFMAKRSVMTKFRKTNKVNYGQEDEIVNNPHSCTSLESSTYQTSKDILKYTDQPVDFSGNIFFCCENYFFVSKDFIFKMSINVWKYPH